MIIIIVVVVDITIISIIRTCAGAKAWPTSVMVSGSHSSMGSGSASISVAKSATDTVPLMATTILFVGLSRASMYGKSPTGQEGCCVYRVVRRVR